MSKDIKKEYNKLKEKLNSGYPVTGLVHSKYIDFIEDQIKVCSSCDGLQAIEATGRVLEMLIDYYIMTNMAVEQAQEHIKNSKNGGMYNETDNNDLT